MLIVDLKNEKYIKALEFATKRHKGQKRKEKVDYINHPIAVSKMLYENGYGLKFCITGLFHDLLEDTETTYDEILQISNKEIADAVLVLTKQKGYNMPEYIQKIKENEIALPVKVFDRIHNLKTSIFCDNEFIKRYIIETKEYYFELEKMIGINQMEKLVDFLEDYIY